VSFFDDEAEEEEEEGAQAGLGDFGFGVTSKLRETEEEKEALKLRKGDLDHIVDSLSDDEGDEDAAIRARMEMERREDKDRTRMIITAVTEGHDAMKLKQQKSKKMGFSFEDLVAGKIPTTNGPGGAEGGDENNNNNTSSASPAEEELDEEELLQRGLQEKMSRYRQRGGGANQSDEEDDEENQGGEDEEEEELERMRELLSSMTEEERVAEIANITRMKEREKSEALKRKQLDKEFKIRRELRLLARKNRSGGEAGVMMTGNPSHQSQSSQSQSLFADLLLGNGNGFSSFSSSYSQLNPPPTTTMTTTTIPNATNDNNIINSSSSSSAGLLVTGNGHTNHGIALSKANSSGNGNSNYNDNLMMKPSNALKDVSQP
jgi:hypothetical protein